jgi:antitoxin component HigA of HigAB toxin-antitoxin module
MRTAAPKTVPDSYMDLIRKFPLRRLKTSAEHLRAKTLVLRLSPGKPSRGTADYLDVLIDLIADFEKRSGQAADTSELSAADLVRHRIEQRGMSISALAREIDVPQSNLSEMLSGKRDWSKAAIRGLAGKLNIRAERLLG